MVFLVLACSVSEVNAAEFQSTFVCTAGDGSKSIQDEPCDSGEASKHIWTPKDLPSSKPFTFTPKKSTKHSRKPFIARDREAKSWTNADAALCRNTQQRKFNIQARKRAGVSGSESGRLRRQLNVLEKTLNKRCHRKVPQEYWVQGLKSQTPPK